MPVALLAIMVAATGLLPAYAQARVSSPLRVAARVRFRIMEFNTDISDEYPTVPVSKVARAIELSGADVATIEEGGGEIPQLAADLGWPYYDIRMQIVSRLPLIDPPASSGIYTLVQLAPGEVVAVENVHLASNPYGPFWARNGVRASKVIALEKRIRLPEVRRQIADARVLNRLGIPVFLNGDFNSCSALDWTKAAIGSRDFNGHVYPPYRLKWPVSQALLNAGFKDSYRVVYPNPVAHPGLTWPVHRTLPGWNPGPNTPADRIDFIYSMGAARATASRLIGEPGGPAVSASVSPWPSDHRGVVSTFHVIPGATPTLVSVPQRLVIAGNPVSATYHAPGSASRIAIVPAGGAPGSAVASQGVGARPSNGTVAFATGSWHPGAYQALLLDASDTVLSRFPFWVEAPGQTPVIKTSRHRYTIGQPIPVRWRWAPGDRWDWIAIYHRGANPNVAYYLLWAYTGSKIDGSLRLDRSAHGKWPLPAGRYSVYLLKDDLYVKIAGSNFQIVK